MNFRTPVIIPEAPFRLQPHHRLLFVGSCFASEIGQRFTDNQFHTVVNPYGVMYNPASILHTLERYLPTAETPDVAILTLGTNHVYILKETGDIVDNCQKQPASLFREEELTVQQCLDYLQQSFDLLRQKNPQVHIIITVSPIRYAKYGFHGSQLSKATLLLASHLSTSTSPLFTYFPAYEIMNDELRDYRFYKADMIHPSEQAIEYIYERFAETYFAPETHRFVEEWKPIQQDLAHKPFHPDSPDYQQFMTQPQERLVAFRAKYNL